MTSQASAAVMMGADEMGRKGANINLILGITMLVTTTFAVSSLFVQGGGETSQAVQNAGNSLSVFVRDDIDPLCQLGGFDVREREFQYELSPDIDYVEARDDNVLRAYVTETSKAVEHVSEECDFIDICRPRWTGIRCTEWDEGGSPPDNLDHGRGGSIPGGTNYVTVFVDPNQDHATLVLTGEGP